MYENIHKTATFLHITLIYIKLSVFCMQICVFFQTLLLLMSITLQFRAKAPLLSRLITLLDSFPRHNSLSTANPIFPSYPFPSPHLLAISMLSNIRGLLQVFELLQPEELLFSTQFVCKQWREVVRLDELWETHLGRNQWMTRNLGLDWLLNLPTIACYVVNLRLVRNPRFLFSLSSLTNTIYSVDKDKSGQITLPFATNKAAWVYTPTDILILTGGESEDKAAYQVKLMDRCFEELPVMLSGHQWHAAILWRNGLVVAAGDNSSECEMLADGVWKALSPLNRQRQRHILVTAGQSLYVVGGSSTIIEAYMGESWVDQPFSLPYEVNFPTIAPFQGNYLVLGGADETLLQHKPILQVSFPAQEVTDTGVVFLVVTYSNSISRQGDYLICLDYHGKIKRLSRPDASIYPLPHSRCMDYIEENITIVAEPISLPDELLDPMLD